MSSLSVIIPVFNEAEQIEATVLPLLKNLDIEIIIVDGGSTDQTIEIAQTLGLKVIVSPEKGRAHQMNYGARVATGEIFLFLHADTRLSQGYQKVIEQTLSLPRVIAGAFELAIDGDENSLRWLEKMVNLRSRLLSLPYGDQGIFLKASVFYEMGGFAPIPIMEDFELIQRLKKKGKIWIVPQSILTSGRRWQKLGVWQTTLINQLIILGYYLGIPLHQLEHLYRKK
ncbi:TIGR04283 family arsenosugar biosynthesis glycosyltransferase [Chroococcus sp. FPU101]|uniref:TIGR04283 family arsenosugar biosynthesis glycosyltransferase n=1 Tax=Chroococcus sp. FPU101 TaxID=1974212 RepID=UPI001A8D51E5|nr:TIGR04283 family arsenosugar biosynthesis glycosyltransferase [Chroococcus sp. FPU101]GFE69700.1 glycosyl transferase family 2 [Chroococcus sp. FPU101]